MMPGFWQIILVVVLVLLLFGRGKISELMGDVAKGINSFKKGLSDDKNADAAEKAKVIDAKPDTAQLQAKFEGPQAAHPQPAAQSGQTGETSAQPQPVPKAG